MKKIDNFLKQYINKILIIFILLQPILDVISGINNNFFKFDISLNIIIRIIFLLCGIFYLLFINNTKYKKISIDYLIIMGIYFILFCISIIFFKDFNVLFFEVKNFVQSFYLPILLVCFFNLFIQYKINIDLKYLFYTFCIYLAFIFIPNITGLSFDSYTQGKIGNSGWFNSANAISSIISIMLPFIVIYLKNNKFNILYLLLFCIFIYCILSLGTKVPLLSLVIILVFNIIYIFISLFKNKQYKNIGIISSIIIIFVIGITLLIPKTSFYKNIIIHSNFLGINSINDVFTIDNIDRFIFSDRLSFLVNTKRCYDKSSIYEKLIGIGYIENYSTDVVSTKMVEIDYYDIYYRHGLIGFIIFFIPIVYIIYSIIRKKFEFNFVNINLALSIFLIFILSLFSGHILIVPNVSIFVCIILIIIYFKNNNNLTKYN